MRFQSGSYKVAIELRVVQFWSEIILGTSNRIRATRSLRKRYLSRRAHSFIGRINRIMANQYSYNRFICM